MSNPGEADGAPIVGGLEMIENDIDFERYFSFSSFFLYFFFLLFSDACVRLSVCV